MKSADETNYILIYSLITTSAQINFPDYIDKVKLNPMKLQAWSRNLF